jgi:hypothetical protein
MMRPDFNHVDNITFMYELDQRFYVAWGTEGGGGELCGRSGQQGPRGGKMCGQINSFNENRSFSGLQNFELLSKTEDQKKKL